MGCKKVAGVEGNGGKGRDTCVPTHNAAAVMPNRGELRREEYGR